MKKIKILSILLSALTAFSGLSITTASATETEEPRMKIIDYPDNVIGTDLEDLLYGWIVQHPDGTTITTDENSFDYVEIYDYFDTLGYGSVGGCIEFDDKYFHFGASMYLADTVVLNASTPGYGDINGFDSVEIPFPSDYEKPDVFCYDNYIYEKNGDNTLTLKGNISVDYSYDRENGGLYYEPIVIPESIDGMTVTAIADGAFLGEHITDVTIPDTVTSIDKYAFGYCFNIYGGGEIHEYSNPIGASPRGYEFLDAPDNEEFFFDTYYYGENIEEYAQYLKDTYFTDNTELEINYRRISGKATKAELLTIIEKEDLYFYFGSNDTVINEYLYCIMKNASDEDLIPITIDTTATGEISANKIRKALKSRYFDEDTEFYYDYYECIYVNATKVQIEALKEDEYVDYIELGDSQFISQALHYAMYGADLEDTFDLFVTASYMEDAEVYLRDAHEAYFSNCKGSFMRVQGELIYVIYGATKEQITNAAEVDEWLFIRYFGQPAFNRYYNLTIYGEAGSYAEEYAKANGINFEQTKSEYELGDVNLDGTVTIVDATLIMKANVGMKDLSEQQTKLADFNNDGIVNVVDATDIQKRLAGF